jgi:transcriptional regulator with XRE-family HTH domain
VQPKHGFGENARRLRAAARLTQMEVADRGGLDMTEVSRLERGIKDPRLSTIVRLAAGLGVEPAELLAGLGPAQRPDGPS